MVLLIHQYAPIHTSQGIKNSSGITGAAALLLADPELAVGCQHVGSCD